VHLVATVNGKALAVAAPAAEAYLYAGRLSIATGGYVLKLDPAPEPDRLDPVRTMGAELDALLETELGAEVETAEGEPSAPGQAVLDVHPPEPLAHFLARVAEILRA